MVARSFTPGDRVAKGNTSDVFQWTSTTVVKVLRPGIPPGWAMQEADITRGAHAAGLPVPAADGIVEVDGRAGIVFERIDGRSMWDLMKATPRELPQLIDALIGLQTAIHGAGPIGDLPLLMTRVREKIDAVTALPAEDRQEARGLLDRLPTATALCHGDMHPANILMSSRGMVVVDWFDAAIGHPTADYARSSLLMRPTASSRSVRAFLGGATPAFLARLAEPVASGDLRDIWAAYKAGPTAGTRSLRPG